jgi:hypothetical protein
MRQARRPVRQRDAVLLTAPAQRLTLELRSVVDIQLNDTNKRWRDADAVDEPERDD